MRNAIDPPRRHEATKKSLYRTAFVSSCLRGVIAISITATAGVQPGAAARLKDSPSFTDAGARASQASDDTPSYTVDASWPKPLPNHWLVGAVAGIAVDSRDHVW